MHYRENCSYKFLAWTLYVGKNPSSPSVQYFHRNEHIIILTDFSFATNKGCSTNLLDWLVVFNIIIPCLFIFRIKRWTSTKRSHPSPWLLEGRGISEILLSCIWSDTFQCFGSWRLPHLAIDLPNDRADLQQKGWVVSWRRCYFSETCSTVPYSDWRKQGCLSVHHNCPQSVTCVWRCHEVLSPW